MQGIPGSALPLMARMRSAAPAGPAGPTDAAPGHPPIEPTNPPTATPFRMSGLGWGLTGGGGVLGGGAGVLIARSMMSGSAVSQALGAVGGVALGALAGYGLTRGIHSSGESTRIDREFGTPTLQIAKDRMRAFDTNGDGAITFNPDDKRVRDERKWFEDGKNPDICWDDGSGTGSQTCIPCSTYTITHDGTKYWNAVDAATGGDHSVTLDELAHLLARRYDSDGNGALTPAERERMTADLPKFE